MEEVESSSVSSKRETRRGRTVRGGAKDERRDKDEEDGGVERVEEKEVNLRYRDIGRRKGGVVENVRGEWGSKGC